MISWNCCVRCFNDDERRGRERDLEEERTEWKGKEAEEKKYKGKSVLS